MSVLDRDDIERIAARVAELLDDRPPPFARYVDAATVARLLAVDRDWVYAHARELGAIRLGGPQGRLRFDIDQLHQTLATRSDHGARTAVGGSAKRLETPRESS